ncbi:MAG: alanine racemase [Oscillospiraceae bacterium]|nr:alanine racemase [Oscillospiraceae bacterium]
MSELEKRTWAEVNLDNIRHNYRAIRNSLPAGCRFLGVVKANAYGHGALEVAKVLEECGADYLAVSCLDEAMELRDGGISMPVLILGHTPCEYTRMLVENDITQTITCLAKAVEFSEEAARLGKELKVHIALDTGMSRLGVLCMDDRFDGGVENIIRACKMPGLKPEGVFTHFAVSDTEGADNERYTREQFRLFCEVIDEVRAKGGVDFQIRHCANSGAVVNYPEMCLDMVRPGLLLYGYGDPENRLGLKPCLRFVSKVTTIKHYAPGTDVSYGRRYTTDRVTRMGVLGVGYADGLPRLASNQCSFAVAGGLAPQRGTICMDMCMIDLTDLPAAAVGSEVEIFGPVNPIETVASAAKTIPYELLCALSKRVPRVYKKF